MSVTASSPRPSTGVAAALASARRALDEPEREVDGPLSLLARRFLGAGTLRSTAGDAALREWFSVTGRLPADALDVGSVERLLLACGEELRPRALELADLLATLDGKGPAETGRPVRAWALLDRGGGGLALRLRAVRVNGVAGLAADARLHAFDRRDASYRRAESTAGRVLRRLRTGAAVRYSLWTEAGDPYADSIEDASLGAALAAAALEAVRSSPLREVDARSAVTGTLASDGGIGAVDPAGLFGKARAAQRVGARRLIVPGGQAPSLAGTSGVRVRGVRTVEEARSAMRVVRARAKVAAVALAAFVALSGVATHEIRSAGQDERRRELAAERAMHHALELTVERPRAALALTGAAGLLAPEATAAARSLVAASLPPGVRYLPDPPAPATALAWTAVGIVVATSRRLLALDRDRGGWRTLRRLPGHRVAAFDADARLLVLGGRRGAVLLDRRRGNFIRLTSAPARTVAAGSGAAVLTRAGDVVAWDRRDGARQLVSPAPLTAIAYAGERGLVAGDRAGRILRRHGGTFAYEAGEDRMTVSPPRIASLAAADRHVVAANPQGAVFDRVPARADAVGMTGPPVFELLALSRGRAAVVRPGSSIEVVAVDDNYLRVRLEQSLAGRFRTAAISPDGRRLLAAGREAAILRLDTSYTSPALLTGAVAFGHRRRLLAMDDVHGGLLRLRPVGDPDVVVRPAGVNELGAVKLSPNGRWAAQLQGAGDLRRFDLRSGAVRVVRTRSPTGGGPVEDVSQHVGVLDDGRVSLSRSSGDDFEGSTFIFDPVRGKAESGEYPGYAPFALGLPGGRLLLARGEQIELLRIEDMELLARAGVEGAYVNTLAARADGEAVFFGSAVGDVWSWRPGDRDARPRRLAKIDGSLRSLVASRDGSVIFGTAFRGLRAPARLFAIDTENAWTALLDTPETAAISTAALAPGGEAVAFTSSLPVGAVLLSAQLAPREACARASRAVAPALWRRAVGELDVSPARCPG